MSAVTSAPRDAARGRIGLPLRLALLATLVASAWFAGTGGGDAVVDAVSRVGPNARPAPAPRAPAAGAAILPIALWPTRPLRDGADATWPPLSASAGAAWTPPPPAAPAAPVAADAAARANVAPPFPFTVIGRWRDDATGRSLLLLAGAQRTYAAAAGEVLAGEWRIDAVDDSAAVVTYLPLGSAQTVSFPAP